MSALWLAVLALRPPLAPTAYTSEARRALIGAAVSAALPGRAAARSDRDYGAVPAGPFVFGTPLLGPPRATVRRELVPGRIWSFEQVQGLIFVHVPVRMTVIALDGGGLLVYAPIAPTAECLRLLAEVEASAGPVRHVLLPSLALEHKAFAGSFARARPEAQLWVAPGQYSFPVDLPLPAQGFPQNTRVLPYEGSAEAAAVPWAAQLPYKVLGPIGGGLNTPKSFTDVVLFDKPTATLLVTDLVVSVPSEPPAVVRVNDERALRYHARDTAAAPPLATDEALAKGWQKICLFSLYFQSSPLTVSSPPDGTPAGAVRFLKAAFPPMPDEARALGWRGFWAWSWQPQWRDNFEALRMGGAPLVPPIVQCTILNRDPKVTLEFVDAVARDFPFRKIVPAHFEPVDATPREWCEAFNFLRKTPLGGRGELPDADLAFLRMFEATLVKAGTLPPALGKV